MAPTTPPPEPEPPETQTPSPTCCWPPIGAAGVLLVIAHPDDEAMFFAPALTALNAHKKLLPVRVLCLSTGNAAGLGAVRQRELAASVDSLLKEVSHAVMVADDPRLTDGMHEQWEPEYVAKVVECELRTAREDGGKGAGAEDCGSKTPQRVELGRRGGENNKASWALLTFDAQGVSGHPNHRDTSAGVLRVARSGSPLVHSAWTLRSEPLAIKFLGCFGALAVAARERAAASAATVVVAPTKPPLPILASLRAMRLHASQWVWFRWLFVAFSTYGWVNVLDRVV
jgi:N-acetylglucosaminylphosphatidylinositol deacetylase